MLALCGIVQFSVLQRLNGRANGEQQRTGAIDKKNPTRVRTVSFLLLLHRCDMYELGFVGEFVVGTVK